MFNGLRFRLIVSYIVIIAVCLAIMAMALALLVRSNPLGRELTQERLTLSLNSVTRLVQKDLRDGTAPDQVMTDLPVRFDTQQTRVLFFTGLNRRIIADSDDALGGRDLGEFALGLPVRLPDGTITGNINVGDTQPWIYVARPTASGPHNVGILVAQAPQSISLRSPIYTQMLRQLAFAGCIGGALSVLLALLIAGSVSSPLRRLTKAANAIAEGDYDQTVPIQGPTKVHELARNFNSMAEQVRGSQQSQRDLLANVSHELKTPLNSIQGFAQAISDGAAGDAGFTFLLAPTATCAKAATSASETKAAGAGTPLAPIACGRKTLSDVREAIMRVYVKLFATLRRYVDNAANGVPFEVDLPEGATIADLIHHLNLPVEEVKLAFVNARARPEDWRLEPGDEVGIFPPVGGG